MKYIRGNQTYSLEECTLIKVRLTDNDQNDPFVESPWAKRYKDSEESVLQNHALAFLPFHSWGAVLPVVEGQTLDFIPFLEKEELTFHPEAFDNYLASGVIDAEGNYIFKREEKKCEGDCDCNCEN